MAKQVIFNLYRLKNWKPTRYFGQLTVLTVKYALHSQKKHATIKLMALAAFLQSCVFNLYEMKSL